VVVVEAAVALVAVVAAEEEILVVSGAAASNDNPTRLIKRERSMRPLPFFLFLPVLQSLTLMISP
jgi:hypothetical protein